MKKKTLKVTSKRNHRFYPLLLCTALACTACGADNQAEQNTSQESGQTSTSDTVDNNQPPQTEDGGQAEEDNKQAEEANGQSRMPPPLSLTHLSALPKQTSQSTYTKTRRKSLPTTAPYFSRKAIHTLLLL